MTLDNAIMAARRSFRRTLIGTSVLPAVIMSVMAAVMIAIILYLVSVSRWVERSDRIISQILSIEKLHIDMETGLRGYRITKDPDFLAPYKTASISIPDAFNELARLASGNEVRMSLIDDIRALSDDWLVFAKAGVQRIDQDVPPSLEVAKSGKEKMDKLRMGMKQMRLTEERKRSDRIRHSEAAAIICVVATILITLAVATLLATVGRKEMRRVANVYVDALETADRRNDEVKAALLLVDQELEVVAEIQRSLLPQDLPKITGLQLAAAYLTSRRVGGDYYDFFRLPGDTERWGILIADVAGHGTPAAVLMAVTHSLAHSLNEPPAPPSAMLQFVNQRLCERYTAESGTFVTAFYGIYEAPTRKLLYTSAGHPPPRVRHAGDGHFSALDDAQSLPLGIDPAEKYFDRQCTLEHGDTIVLYTDGITETLDPAHNEEFGAARLDAAIEKCSVGTDPCTQSIESLITATLTAVDDYSGHDAAKDDRTLLIVRVEESSTTSGKDQLAASSA